MYFMVFRGNFQTLYITWQHHNMWCIKRYLVVQNYYKFYVDYKSFGLIIRKWLNQFFNTTNSIPNRFILFDLYFEINMNQFALLLNKNTLKCV